MTWSPMNLALWAFEFVARMNEQGKTPPYNNADYDKFVELGLMERIEVDGVWCCRLTDDGRLFCEDKVAFLEVYESRLRDMLTPKRYW